MVYYERDNERSLRRRKNNLMIRTKQYIIKGIMALPTINKQPSPRPYITILSDKNNAYALANRLYIGIKGGN